MPKTPETGGLEQVRQLTDRENRLATCPRSGKACDKIVSLIQNSPEGRVPFNVNSFNDLNSRARADGTDMCSSNGGSEDLCGYEQWTKWLSSIADENTVD